MITQTQNLNPSLPQISLHNQPNINMFNLLNAWLEIFGDVIHDHCVKFLFDLEIQSAIVD